MRPTKSKVLFDTNVYITHKAAITAHGEPGWHSVVVWQELMVGAKGRKALQVMADKCKQLEKEGRLLVPDREAWMMAGRILNAYLGDLARKSKTGARPQLEHWEKQSIIRDVLIAVAAKKAGVTVVSDNRDFPTIRRYYDFKWVSAHDYFNAV